MTNWLKNVKTNVFCQSKPTYGYLFGGNNAALHVYHLIPEIFAVEICMILTLPFSFGQRQQQICQSEASIIMTSYLISLSIYSQF